MQVPWEEDATLLVWVFFRSNWEKSVFITNEDLGKDDFTASVALVCLPNARFSEIMDNRENSQL